LDKHRVYDLAKELNTNSKRLMEKLAEINIIVKNHMSLLSDKELDALYKHIGVIKHVEKTEENEEKKDTASESQPKPEIKREIKKGPRIIRTTQVIIDTRSNDDEYTRKAFSDAGTKSQARDSQRNNKDVRRPEFVKAADTNSGLMSGLSRTADAYLGRNKRKEDIKTGPINETVVKTVKDIDEKIAETEEKKDIIVETNKETAEIKSPTSEMKKPVKEQKASDEEIITEKQKNDKDVSSETLETKTETVSEAPKKIKQIADSEKINSETVQSTETQRTEHTARQQSDRPQGTTTGYSGNRPQGDRPQGTGYAGNRPQGTTGYSGNRPQGDRPQGTGYAGNRPQGTGYAGNRPQGDRPQGTGYAGNRPQGDRPQGTGYAGNRPQGTTGYSGNRPQGTTGYSGNRPQGDRPQGTGYAGNRPQGTTGYSGSRPQGDRPQGAGFNKPQQGRNTGRPMDIPKPEFSDSIKEELNAQKSGIRREFQVKDIDKNINREQKREMPKGTGSEKSRKFNPQSTILGQKKGVSEVLSEDFILEEFYTDDEGRRRIVRGRRDGKNQSKPKYIPPRAVLTLITVPEFIIVKDFAEALKKTSTVVIKKLMEMGMMATLNQEIDFDTATLIADEFGIKTERAIEIKEEDILFDETEENEENAQPRPPVVVVMGHVDHGKTSLLDAIRETNVFESESGGITQHIGAYTVKAQNRNITFLDTPGHEAFTAMRARGAQVTDIAILVVAADDGVMPQTVEAINHAKAANVSIIVAINKIDKPGASSDRIKQELTEHGLVSEEWGGDVIFVEVSAKEKTNIDLLLENVLISADMLELKADPDKQAKGTIIEAKLDKKRGPVATVLVQRGTLKLSDSIVTGTTVGRIRAMLDDKGHEINKAGPSMPVKIIGLPNVPEAGEIFYAIEDEKVAKNLAEKRKLKIREATLKASSKITLDDLYTQILEGKVKDLNLIIKADVQGSVEAINQSLKNLSNNEVRVKIIHSGVGAVTESDITLAAVSNAIIIGFNVRPGANVFDAAKDAGVDMRLYSVIYNAINDVQSAMTGMLEPTYKEVVQGHAEIRQIIKISSIGMVAGSYVTDGKITRNSEIRVVRGGIVEHTGKLESLKRFKDDVKEVLQGFECGISIEKFDDLKEGDVIESYVMEEEKR